jgi:hypothetical protein
MHHVRQKGTIFQATTLLELPPDHQQAIKATTLLGTTKESPNQLKIVFHKA